MTPTSNALVGYAVLRANYNADASSYIDNFQSFALDALSQYHPESAKPREVSQHISDKFGLTIPDLVVGKILRRARANKFVDGSPEVGFTLTEDGIRTTPGVGKLSIDYGRRQSELVNKFSAYVTVNHESHTDLLQVDVGEKLGQYFEAHAVPLLAQSLRGESIPSRPIEPGYDFLISSFVAYCSQSDARGFEYIEDAVKGAILASVLLLDTSSLQSSLNKLTLYLDTPVIIDALGYHGDSACLAANQMLNLARKLGANIAAFEHNVREVEGVLDGAQYALRATGTKNGTPGRVVAEFVAQRATPADVAVYVERIHEDLESLRVEIKPRPADYGSYGLDESLLEAELDKAIRYRSMAARKHDVDSLSAIHRLRKGESTSRLERARAVLVTTNGGLAKASQNVAGEEHVWPLSMTSSAIAALLWVRSPVVSDDLPRAQILASAYAGMQPDSYLWEKYLDGVLALEQNGRITPNDALLLRAGMKPRFALMDTTLGDSDEISPETLVEVLDRLKTETVAPIAQQLSDAEKESARATVAAEEASRSWLHQQEVNRDLEARVREAEATSATAVGRLKDLEEKESSLRVTIRCKSERKAKITVVVSTLLLALTIAAPAGISFVAPSVVQFPAWLQGGIVFAGFVLVSLAAIREFIPGTVWDWLMKVQVPLSDHLERKALKRANLDF